MSVRARVAAQVRGQGQLHEHEGKGSCASVRARVAAQA